MENNRNSSKIEDFIKDKWFYIVALLVPWIIGLGHSYIANTWVTGNGNIASGDLQGQIIPIAFEYWDKVHSGDSFAFTWHIADGVNFGSLPGYLNSPFTKIMLLLPRHMIPDYMQFVMLAKWSLTAFSMVFFFYHTRYNTLKDNKKAVSLFLGLAYALGTGIMSFITFVQFMDALIMFPFLLILLENMVFKGKWKAYFLVLLYTISLNSYIGFQICVFLILWYIMLLFDAEQGRLKKFCIFAGVSFLSAATTFGGIIGGLSLASGRLQENATGTSVTKSVSEILISVHEFIEHMFMYESIEQVSSYSPNIYITVTAVFLVLLFPMIKLKTGKKLYMMGVMVFLTLSFFIRKLNLFWHLFNEPNGLHHRFMYLYAFYLLFMALMVMANIDDIKLAGVIAAGLIAILAFTYTFLHIKVFGQYIIYIGTIMIIAFMIIVNVLLKRKSITAKHAICTIIICGAIEMTLSSFQAFSYFEDFLFYGDGGLVDQECELLSKAELSPGERVSSLSPTPNIGLITGQNSDSVFMSAINTDNKKLHERLGMAFNSNVEFGLRGASPLINLIYNIRYGHGESEMVFSDTEPVDRTDYYSLYRIKRLAGLGYMVNDAIKDWSLEDKNCFQIQNDFVKQAVAGDEIFSPAKINGEFSDYFGVKYEPVSEMLQNGVYEYTVDKPLKNEYDARNFELHPEEDMDLYMYFFSPNYLNVFIFIDGDCKHADSSTFMQSTYHIGEVKKGQKIVVCIAPSTKSIYSGDSYRMDFMFGKFNEEAYAKAYEQLSKNIYEVEEETSTYIKGKINADDSGIMMTSVPAEDNFNVYVDGKKTEYDVIGGALIGVPMNAGEHLVEFKYESSGGFDYWNLLRNIIFTIYFAVVIISTFKENNIRFKIV